MEPIAYASYAGPTEPIAMQQVTAREHSMSHTPIAYAQLNEYRGPVYQELVEMPAPVTYLAPPTDRQVIMQQPVQEVVKVIQDDVEIIALRNELEERVQLINDFGRFNAELQQRNVELERLLGESESKLSMANSERQTLQRGLGVAEQKLKDSDAENGSLRDDRDRASLLAQDFKGRDENLEDEVRRLQDQVATLRAQDERLRSQNSEQAQRIADLEGQDVGLEHDLNQKQLEVDSLARANEELEARFQAEAQRGDELEARLQAEVQRGDELETRFQAEERRANELEDRFQAEAQRVVDLEAMVEDLQRRPAAAEPPPEPAHHAPHHAPASNLSDDDLMDGKIQEFFMAHTDFQMAVNKEKPGLYSFDHPINKKVNMKVQGERVLARIGGGWQVLEEWLLEERQHFLEAEDMEDHLETAPVPAPAPTKMRAPAAKAAPRSTSAAPKRAAAKRTAASKAPGVKAAAKPAAGGARSASAASGRSAPGRVAPSR